MNVGEINKASFSYLVELANSIKSSAKIDRILKGSLLTCSGITIGTLLIAKVVVLSSFLTPIAIITSLALIALGIKYLATSFEKAKKIDATIPPENESSIEALPEEILLKIFEYVPAKQIGNPLAVCSKWNQIGHDDALWRSHFQRNFNRTPFSEHSVKDEYAEIMALPFLPNLIKGNYTKLAEINTDQNRAVSVSPDGETIAWGEDFDLHIISRNEDHLKTFSSPIRFEKLDYSADGTKIIGIGVTRMNFGTITWNANKAIIWNANGKILGEFEKGRINHGDGSTTYTCLSHVVSPRGNKIILWGGQSHIFDINTKEEISLNFFTDENYIIKTAAFSYDETQILIAFVNLDERSYDVELWDLSSKKGIKVFSIESPFVSSLSFSQNGKIIAIGGYNNQNECSISLFDVETGELLRECPCFPGREFPESEHLFLVPHSIEFLPGDSWAVVSYLSTKFDPESPKKQHQLLNVKWGQFVHSFEGVFTGSWKVKIERKNEIELWTSAPQKIKKKSFWDNFFRPSGIGKYPVFVEDL